MRKRTLPGSTLTRLGRAGAFDVILAAYSLAAPLWQVANPPEKLAEAYAEAKAEPQKLKQDEPLRVAIYQFHTDMSLAG